MSGSLNVVVFVAAEAEITFWPKSKQFSFDKVDFICYWFQ